MKLLISESPLQVIPSLAVAIGLNEAIVLQQMHYWLVNKANSNDQRSYHDGTYWVFNTYEEWQEQFPFWSARTIRRTITSLQDQGLLIVGNYNKMAIDNTKWYTVNYASEKLVDRPCGQNGQTMWPTWTDHAANVDRPCGQVGQANNQRLSTKTTTEITSDINVSKPKKRFTPPTRNEVLDHMLTKHLPFDLAEVESEKFINFYESKGWLVGKAKMKNWKAAASNWVTRCQTEKKTGNQQSHFDYSVDQARRLFGGQ